MYEPSRTINKRKFGDMANFATYQQLYDILSAFKDWFAGLLEGKQRKLIPGDNITIENNKISKTDTTYTASDGLSIRRYGTSRYIDCDSSYTIQEEHVVVTSTDNHMSLYSYKVSDSLTGREVEFANAWDIKGSSGSYFHTYDNPTYLEWTFDGTDEGYANLFNISSSTGCYAFEVQVVGADGSVVSTHKMLYDIDTPDKATYTYITSFDWDHYARVESSQIFTYFKAPAGFVGKLRFRVLYVHV